MLKEIKTYTLRILAILVMVYLFAWPAIDELRITGKVTLGNFLWSATAILVIGISIGKIWDDID